MKELRAACEKLGGTKLPQGDAGYRIPVYPYFDMAVLFWDRDDEFEAQEICCLILISRILSMKRMWCVLQRMQ